ncbi:MAG: chromosomal replication initiator protein DnaA [Acidimicrobiales bacterium]
MDDAEVLWTSCAEVLRGQVSEAVWLTTFNAAQPVTVDGDALVLAVPSSVVRERIETRYLTLMQGALTDVGSPIARIRLEVHTEPSLGAADPVAAAAEALAEPVPAAPAAAPPPVPGASVGTSAPGPAAGAPGGSPFLGGVNPRYSFDDFVIGTSNRFAHAAALAVAETPARSYNPLFIYGDAGLGKTHLLQAIANYVQQHYPTYIVRYVSSERYLNEFIDSIRTSSQAQFKQRYREADVLLIDDIQFIQTSERLQEELFHNFEHLYQANKQIVFSSDRPPASMATLEDRLRSRFMMGLITDIQPPDLETRLAILRKKAEKETVYIPPDVLELIATHITDNIRELEGALIRVSAFASLNKEPLSVDLAQRVLADMLTDSQPRPITPDLILQKTSEMFDFSIDEIRGKSRRRPLVTARQISMYVFRELTDLSYPAIAREFGGRDHTTVMHAVEKIGDLMKERRQIYDQVTELTQSIRSGS